MDTEEWRKGAFVLLMAFVMGWAMAVYFGTIGTYVGCGR